LAAIEATRVPEMKAIFFAAGPDIRHGVALEPFENANLYPLIAWDSLDITNLKTGPVDGKPGVLDRSLTATRVIFLAAAQNALGNCFQSQASEQNRNTESHRNIQKYIVALLKCIYNLGNNIICWT
jgi:hypothetical protein